MTILGTFDPKRVSTVFGGNLITGFAEAMITARRNAKLYEMEVGADGEVGRYATNNRAGTVTVELLATSKSNLVLTEIANADEVTGAGVFPLTIRDTSGAETERDLLFAAEAWISEYPEVVYRRGVEARRWTIECSDLRIFLAGNDAVPAA